MGIDCPDIANIYHWGSIHTMEEYVQEIGMAVRNQMPSYATLIYKKAEHLLTLKWKSMALILPTAGAIYCTARLCFIRKVPWRVNVNAVTFAL